MITKFYSLKFSKTFNQILNVAISNAASDGHCTVNAKAIRDVAIYRLKHYVPDYAGIKAELTRMSTLRGVINSSNGMFGKNGRLAEWAESKIRDLVRINRELQEKYCKLIK